MNTYLPYNWYIPIIKLCCNLLTKCMYWGRNGGMLGDKLPNISDR
ncbi:hypothetical protein IFVP203_C1140200 [Vibrio parahaemolyticus]